MNDGYPGGFALGTRQSGVGLPESGALRRRRVLTAISMRLSPPGVRTGPARFGGKRLPRDVCISAHMTTSMVSAYHPSQPPTDFHPTRSAGPPAVPAPEVAGRAESAHRASAVMLR